MAASYFPTGCHGNYDEDEASLLRERGAYVTCAYRSCGQTFKTLETLERHVKSYHMLTWDAYTRYISGSGEDGDEEDEVNSKKRDAYCICTYMECGRKFKMLKSLEEHVTLYHNLSWQNYTMYYHRLGKDNSASADVPAKAQEKSKLSDKSPPQKVVPPVSTRLPLTSSGDKRLTTKTTLPEKLAQPVLPVGDVYQYVPQVALPYYDYSLLAPYLSPAVISDPSLWSYMNSSVYQDSLLLSSPDALNLAKKANSRTDRDKRPFPEISRPSVKAKCQKIVPKTDLRSHDSAEHTRSSSPAKPKYRHDFPSKQTSVLTNIVDCDRSTDSDSSKDDRYLPEIHDGVLVIQPREIFDDESTELKNSRSPHMGDRLTNVGLKVRNNYKLSDREVHKGNCGATTNTWQSECLEKPINRMKILHHRNKNGAFAQYIKSRCSYWTRKRYLLRCKINAKLKAIGNESAARKPALNLYKIRTLDSFWKKVVTKYRTYFRKRQHGGKFNSRPRPIDTGVDNSMANCDWQALILSKKLISVHHDDFNEDRTRNICTIRNSEFKLNTQTSAANKIMAPELDIEGSSCSSQSGDMEIIDEISSLYKSKFTCQQCHLTNINKPHFIYHLLTHHSLYRCALCMKKCPRGGNIYRYQETLKRHLLEIHGISCVFNDLRKYSKKTSFAGKQLKGIHSIEDTDQLLAVTAEKMFFSTGVVMSYNLHTPTRQSDKSTVTPLVVMEIKKIYTCRFGRDFDEGERTEGSEGISQPVTPHASSPALTPDKLQLYRSTSIESDPDEPKLIIAENESCDSLSSSSNPDSFRYKGPKKRFLKGLKDCQSDSPTAKPKESFNLRHCINQIIDSDIIRSRLLNKEEPSAKSPVVLNTLEITQSSSPLSKEAAQSPKASIATTFKSGLKVRDIIQESVTQSVKGNTNSQYTQNKEKEENGNPLLQMAALASMLPRQPVPTKEASPVSPSPKAVPLTPSRQEPKMAEHLREPPTQQYRPYMPQEQRYLQSQDYFNSMRSSRVSQPGLIRQPPPLLKAVSPKAGDKRVPQSQYLTAKPRQVSPVPMYKPSSVVTSSVQGGHVPSVQGGHVPSVQGGHIPSVQGGHIPSVQGGHIPSVQGGHIPSVQGGHIPSVLGAHIPSVQSSHTPSVQTVPSLPVQRVGESVPAVPGVQVAVLPTAMPTAASIMDTTGALVTSGSLPLVAGYVYSPQGIIYPPVLAAEKETPLDLSRKQSDGNSEDLPLDLSVKATRHQVPKVSQPQRTNPLAPAVVKAAQTWYPHDQHAAPSSVPFTRNDSRQSQQANNPHLKSMASSLSRHLQTVHQPFRTVDPGVRPHAVTTLSMGYQARSGYVGPKVAEVRPIISQQTHQTSQTHSQTHHMHGQTSQTHQTQLHNQIPQARQYEKPRSHSPHAAGMQMSPTDHNMQEYMRREVTRDVRSDPPRALSPRDISRDPVQHPRDVLPKDQANQMRPRSASTSSLIGNHPVDDILYLKCNVCSSTYGSLNSFRKHFGKAHGFEPRPEHVTVRSIAAAKSNERLERQQDIKYQYLGHPSPPAFRVSPTGSTRSSPGVAERMSPQILTSPHMSPRPDNKDKPVLKQRSVMQCFQCGQDFPTRDWGVFKRHMRAHEMPQLRCNICRQSFNDEHEFRDHNLTYHPVQNYPCRMCELTFNHPAALAKHIKLTHPESPDTDAPNLQCMYCPHVFNSLPDLTTHIREHEKMLGINPKDYNTAQHSPQIRRASPDSTNDPEEGSSKKEEKQIVTPNVSCQGVPIFNINPVRHEKKPVNKFRNMSIMDIVREKVEEASRKYLSYDFSHEEKKADQSENEQQDKEIAIKQEVSMEVKQEIGDKVYVMNYQEKGMLTESKVQEIKPKQTEPKDSQGTAKQEPPKVRIGHPIFRLDGINFSKSENISNIGDKKSDGQKSAEITHDTSNLQNEDSAYNIHTKFDKTEIQLTDNPLTQSSNEQLTYKLHEEVTSAVTQISNSDMPETAASDTTGQDTVAPSLPQNVENVNMFDDSDTDDDESKLVICDDTDTSDHKAPDIKEPGNTQMDDKLGNTDKDVCIQEIDKDKNKDELKVTKMLIGKDDNKPEMIEKDSNKAGTMDKSSKDAKSPVKRTLADGEDSNQDPAKRFKSCHVSLEDISQQTSYEGVKQQKFVKLNEENSGD